LIGGPLDLRRFPAHLGLGAAALSLPEMAGADWYEACAARTAADGDEGRLVSLHDFDSDWTAWEMHPAGDEVVICISGAITVIQQRAEGAVEAIALKAGEYAINPAGVWHTANVADAASVLFITPGLGTDHRPRSGLQADE